MMDTPLRLTCIAILDAATGDRICSQYPKRAPLGGPPVYCTFDTQRKFELKLHQAMVKIKGRTEAEAMEVEGEVAVGLGAADIFIFAAAPAATANELLLLEIVESIRSVLNTICSGSISRQALLDNMDSVLLALDEYSDQGLLLETNPSSILARINLQGDNQANQETAATLNQAISQAKDSIIRSLLSGAS